MPSRELTAGTDYTRADERFEALLRQLADNDIEFEEGRMRRAYAMARTAHEGQIRKDGTPYILHPLEVAGICAEMSMDEDAIIAALLHDTVEDTGIKLAQIQTSFNRDVSAMVDSLTKIKKIDFFARFTGRDKASNQARNLQKLFVAMTSDSRVIAIKLADRLHNMRTLESMPDHKRQRISRETMEFYIPIARRLGFGQMTTELEDLAFMHLNREKYEETQREANAYFKENEFRISEVIGSVKRLLEENGITVKKISGRRKHLWSIYEKMHKQHVGIDGIYDLLAIRVIISGTALDCYQALGLIHQRYKPIFHRFRDFIASPKENGYQTLHTTLIVPGGICMECQIRTVEMDDAATKGIASHWQYKENRHLHDHLSKDQAWLNFISELSEENVDSEQFVSSTRGTLLANQVLVLSPRGEVVNLPVGSTPIDFAYYIHTDLGHSIRTAKVNGHNVPLDYELRNGDVVEVGKGGAEDYAPRPEWLVMAKSPKSLLKVRRYFKSLPFDKRVEIGRGLLRQQIVNEGFYPLNLTANDKLMQLLRMLKVKSIDDLYNKVVLGVFDSEDIIEKLKTIHLAQVDVKPASESEEVVTNGTGELALIGLSSEIGARLKGGAPLRRKAELMNCCTPVPGDNIYGIYDRTDRRVKIHRVECRELQESLGQETLMELEWSDGEEKTYPARIRVTSLNRVGLLFEVLRLLSQEHVNLGGASFAALPTMTGGGKNAEFELTIEVANAIQLGACMQSIANIEDVFDVRRSFHSLPRRAH